jgi:hypothetical protein
MSSCFSVTAPPNQLLLPEVLIICTSKNLHTSFKYHIKEPPEARPTGPRTPGLLVTGMFILKYYIIYYRIHETTREEEEEALVSSFSK